MKTSIVSIVKNCENSIPEWVAFHLAVGFDAVVVLDNASTDGTRQVVQTRFPDHDVRLIDWPMTGPAYQVAGFEYALWSIRREFDWCMCLDEDEFLVLPAGADAHTFFARFGDGAAAIAFPSAFFGSNGHLTKPEAFIIEAFTRRASEDFAPSRHIKSAVRPERVVRCVSPHFFDVDGDYMEPTGKLLLNPSSLTETPLPFHSGRINHYAVKSRACWTSKLARGYHDTVREESDFHAYDRNEIYDDSALRWLPRMQEILRSGSY